MNPTAYQKAREAGYSDQEIMDYWSKKNPEFQKKVKKAEEAGYTKEDVIGHLSGSQGVQKQKKDEEQTAGQYILENVKEVPGQLAKGGISGGLGIYGDILEMFGLQPKEAPQQQQEKNKREFEIASKINKGETPNIYDLTELSDQEGIPNFSRLATSEEIEKNLPIEEAKTPLGKGTFRTAKIGAGSAMTGAPLIKAPVYAGAVGQTLEELGAPKWVQAAGEMIGFIRGMPKSKTPITSDSPEIQNVVEKLRKAGYSEQDITLAKSGLEDKKILKKFAKMTGKAEKSIDDAIKHSDELFKEQIHKGLPGYQKGGMGELKNAADKLYSTMEDVAQTVKINNYNPLKNSLDKSIKYLESHAVSEDQRKTINYLKDAQSKLVGEKSGDFFTDFYRGLNKEGKWLNPKQKEHILKDTKDAIKETFAKNSPESQKFGKYFDKVNESWKKWIDVQDAMDLLHKGQKTEGIDWKYINKTMNDKDNYKLIEKALGKEQAQNIHSISQGVDSIKGLETTLRKGKDKSVSGGFKILEGLRALFTKDYRLLSTILGASGAQKLSTKMLTDVKYQNLTKTIIEHAKKGSVQQASIAAQNLQNKLDKD